MILEMHFKLNKSVKHSCVYGEFAKVGFLQ